MSRDVNRHEGHGSFGRPNRTPPKRRGHEGEHINGGGYVKVSFLSEESAQRKLVEKGWEGQQVYRCGVCGFWHHGGDGRAKKRKR